MTNVPHTISSQDDLLRIQREFFRIIRKPLRDGSKMYEDAATPLLIKPNSVLSAHERLELYAQQYWWRVLRIMRTDFKRVRVFLGGTTFTDVVMAYLEQHPSTYPQLKLLGREFSEFIRACCFLNDSQRNIASEIAGVEMASLEVSRAACIAPLSIETLHQFGDAVTIRLQPFVQSVRLSYAIDCLFRDDCEVEDGQELVNGLVLEEDSCEASAEKSLYAMAICDYSIAVYRSHGRVCLCRLDKGEARLLQFLRDAHKLEDICEAVSGCLGEFEMENRERIQTVFEQFAARGWLGVVEG